MTNQVPPAAQPPVQPAYAPAPASVPGKTLGIVALVLAIVVSSVVGLILGYIARNQSRAVGYENTPAKVAIVLGWVFTILGLIGIVLFIVSIAVAASQGVVSGS